MGACKLSLSGEVVETFEGLYGWGSVLISVNWTLLLASMKTEGLAGCWRVYNWVGGDMGVRVVTGEGSLRVNDPEAG